VAYGRVLGRLEASFATIGAKASVLRDEKHGLLSPIYIRLPRQQYYVTSPVIANAAPLLIIFASLVPSPMAALLFKAQLVDQAGTQQAELARILYGVDSPEEKETTFRAICRTRYPQLRIQEPLSISPAKLE
jgi:hypothetical protein